MRLTKIDGNWKIQYFDIKSTGIAPDNTLQVPSNEEIVALVRDSISHYQKAFEAKDVNIFYDNLADLWKQEISISIVEDKLFKTFYANDLKFTGFTADKFIFSKEPVVDTN